MSVSSDLRRCELDLLRSAGYHVPDPDTALDLFEQKIADFFGCAEAVVTDSCTHALEIALRFLPRPTETVRVPCRTYVSVPMTLDKLGIAYELVDQDWTGWYELEPLPLIDAATWWEPRSYQPGKIMTLSFQFKKHLAIGRGGMLLLDDADMASAMRRAVHDGRCRHREHAEDDISTLGFHYYMTPEDAARGIMLFDSVAYAPATMWGSHRYQDLRTKTYFRDRAARS